MSKYDEKSRKEVGKAMHEHKHEGKFKSREQAIAAGLSKARRKGSSAPEK